MAELRVKTRYGVVEGVEESACVVFKGIPYAEAPVGDLRWRAPLPPQPWEGVRMAKEFGFQSAQKDWAKEGNAEFMREFHNDPIANNPCSEDSLFLNIWTPKGYSEALLPVAFYIHGGAFMGGCGHEIEFRTNAYAKRGVILVTINYRLGIFGYLAHPWLLEEDPQACGNYGTMDQMAALLWVRENIQAFGGDPENITIFGQSAGCMSVHTLMQLPQLKGQFSKAILQSGVGYPSMIQKPFYMQQALKFGEKAAEVAQATSLDALRALTLDELRVVQEQVMEYSFLTQGILAFAPALGEDFCPYSVEEAVENGSVADISVMIGSTRNDMTVTEEEAKVGYSQMQQSCRDWALQANKKGRKSTYVYFFTHQLPGDDQGAFHSSELWYMFGTLGVCWRPMTDDDYALSDRMVDYWTNFMKNGDPNGGNLPSWQPCTMDVPFEMILDI